MNSKLYKVNIMPLENFGSILGFAELLESEDSDFYQKAGKNSESEAQKALFEALAADANKHVKLIERTRRENITEMILEPIRDFTRAPFSEDFRQAEGMSASELVATARRMEARAQRYYSEAAEKIKAQPEVSRALKRIGKKRQAHIDRLAAL